MEILESGNKAYVYNGRFTGPVQLEMIIEASVPDDADIARVHCDSGAVTCWHSHPGGQILVLQSGRGRVGDASGSRGGLPPGTTVQTSPGEQHWHGADEGHSAVWLAVTYGVTDWTDKNPLE